MRFLDAFLLSVGLAVDASCVSSADGMAYRPNFYVIIKYSLFFAVFQSIMPMIGYGLIKVTGYNLNHITPYIAFIILGVLGIKMIKDGLSSKVETTEHNKTLTTKLIVIQAISTSIDALSVGTFLTGLSLTIMFNTVFVIAIITFIMCIVAGILGVKVGTKFNNKAEILGGAVLIFLGAKILFGF
ncbi:hypothetical protein AN641_04535 [Candidatus Epulonipiscioides gigas]|nr:hypothetical protein AN641_04535 [Epulopiscium sp. SCG-C07WGA-EpuloA2]